MVNVIIYKKQKYLLFFCFGNINVWFACIHEQKWFIKNVSDLKKNSVTNNCKTWGNLSSNLSFIADGD